MEDRLPDSRNGAEFLREDFSECFKQMCHYDSQIVDVCKFAFIGYSSVVGFAIGIYKYGIEKKVDFVFPAKAIILVGFIVGLLVFCLVIRNRSYFVFVTRYVNELRDHFLKEKPIGFKNKSRMYTDRLDPKYFNMLSSQLLASYIIGFLNATFLGVFLYFENLENWCIVFWVVVILFLQIGVAFYYLWSRDNEATKKNESGNEKK